MTQPDTSVRPAEAGSRRDATVIGLIGLAHGTSHFFHLLLPPLFPLFIREFGLNYSELGLLVTLFFTISGVGQALAGFLVDRIGARPVLFAALGCFVAAAFAAALAHGWVGLAVASALAGLGNAPFHPADFTILNKRVSQHRLGHAFAAHGVTGNLGWAAAPLFLIGIGQAAGSWRLAYLAAALVPLVVLALLALNRVAIDDRRGQWVDDRSPRTRTTQTEHPLAFLRLPSVWLCFSFFFFTTAALAAIQSFAGPALARMYALPVEATGFVVTGYMLFGAGGMLAGGFLVSRVERLERTIAVAMCGSATLLVLVATGAFAAWTAVVVVSVAGVGIGLAGPSRDMLIRRAAPPGATGRVYGTVYSGLDTGFAIGAPVFGRMLDHGMTHGVFLGAALALLLGVLSAGWVGIRTARASALAAA
jgi:MFS transporter, FSR family, fosmidomycin resistance protein